MENIYFNKNRLISFDEKENHFLNAVLFVLVIFLLFFTVFVTLFIRVEIDGQSMNNTLQDGEYALVTKYKESYKNLDIIVLDVGSKDPLIKRIIASENETFMFTKKIVDFKTYVVLNKMDKNGNFYEVDESGYIKENMLTSSFNNSIFEYDRPYTIPSNHYLFLGDNRNDSKDSRFYGFIENEKIIGKAVFHYEPDTFLHFLLSIIYKEST